MGDKGLKEKETKREYLAYRGKVWRKKTQKKPNKTEYKFRGKSD